MQDTAGGNAISSKDQKLIDAAKRGDVEGVREALEIDRANPSVHFRQTLEEITPLVLVCIRGHKEIAELLIEKGADVNEKMGFGHATPLLQAVSNDHIAIVEVLLENNANVNQCDKLGRTPLMDAAENGNLKILKVLLSRKASVDATDKENRTALSYCLDFVSKDESKYFDICHLLVFEYDANVHYRGRTTNRTLLHCAAARGDFDLVKTLVEQKNCPVDVTDSMGYAPITYATKAGYPDIAAYLQRANSDPCPCIIL